MAIALSADEGLLEEDSSAGVGDIISSKEREVVEMFSAELTEEAYYEWTDALIHRCNNSAILVEIHLPHKVYTSSSAVFSKNLSALIIGLSDLDSEVLRASDLNLDKCIKPVIIKDEDKGDDCIQFGFRNGYVVIYFKKPKIKLS